MSDVIIKYNDKLVPVSGCGPTPYLSLDDNVLIYGDKWGLGRSITLNGTITGCNYNDLYSGQTGLVDVFSDSYKTLSVYESVDAANSYSEVYSFSGCSVDNISFSEASYNRVAGYSVSLTSYPSGLTGYFSGTYGVLDPVDNVRINEGNDGFATLNRQVSARGFVTTTIDDALSNAKNYVQGRTGVADILTINQISGFENSSAFTPVLVQTSESIDRLALTYSVSQTYRFPMITGDTESEKEYSFNNNYITTYSTNLTSGAGDDFVTASIQGEIKAGITGADGDDLISGLLEQLSGLSPYAVVSGKYREPNNLKFCQDPISFSVSQDLKARKVSFNASYDNLEFYNTANSKYIHDNTFLDATINHIIDETTQITTITVVGEIKSRGSTKNKYTKSLAYLDQLMEDGESNTAPRIFDFANDYYTAYTSTSPVLSLNKKPTNVVVNANSGLGTISIDATFDNRDRFLGLSLTDYTLNYSPFNTVYNYGFSCNDSLQHLAVDINVKKREKVGLQLALTDDVASEYALMEKATIISGAAYTAFFSSLGEPNTYQEESKSLSVKGGLKDASSGGDPADSKTDNKFNSEVSTETLFSYELKDSEKVNRRVLKS